MTKDRGIVLSVNPSYLCNFRCNFCYLSEEQLSDKTRLDPTKLFELLSEVTSHYELRHIDLYGGEVALLPESYIDQIFQVMKLFYAGPINVITNYSFDSKFFHRPEIDLTVSWDFFAREKHEAVFARMKTLSRPFHILTLASDRLIRASDAELDLFVEKLNELENLATFEIKPYSKNPHNLQEVRFDEFETFLKRWIQREPALKAQFINLEKIKDSLSKGYSAWSDNHLYVTPTGEFAVLDFDDEGSEKFVPVNSLQDYWAWTEEEHRKVASNFHCSQCEFLGHCLSEHLQEVKSLKHSCNGFQGLLRWAKNQDFAQGLEKTLANVKVSCP